MEFWLLSFQFYLRFCSPEKLIYEKELIEALSTIWCKEKTTRRSPWFSIYTIGWRVPLSASCLPNMVHPGLPVESCSFALSFLIYKLPSIDSVATVVLPH